MTEQEKVGIEVLTEEVRGLRQDLTVYRSVMAQVASRRMRALYWTAVVGVMSLVAVMGASAYVLSHEAQRASEMHDTTRAQACVMARNVQSQIATIVSSLPETTSDAFVERAVAALASDPCSLPEGHPEP